MGPTPCDHVRNGLCADCQAEYDEDPAAYEEYGWHRRGRAASAALKAEMEADLERRRAAAVADQI